jgi:chemotaxis protein MotB
MSKPNPPNANPIQVQVRVKRQFSRRHGGAWKVAYADFMTAMMALFLVLWMMSASNAVKASVTGYFHDPRGYTQKVGAGPSNSNEGLMVHRDNVADVKRQLQQALERMPEFKTIRENVLFSVTGEGLRIELLETEQGMFFVSGRPAPTPAGERLLKTLAGELGSMPNRLVIEGHTDSRAFRNATPDAGYGNWELSVERGNAARRLLHSFGIRPDQIAEVRGFADQRPLEGAAPDESRNRRVSVVVRFAQ